MAIGNVIQASINQVQSQRTAEIERAKQKAHQEKIAPFNAEIETSKQKAIAELTQQFQAKVAELQQALEGQKKEICEASEKKKADFAQMTLMSVEAEVATRYDKVLADLAKIAEYTDKE
jgi:hypothetical protein